MLEHQNKINSSAKSGKKDNRQTRVQRNLEKSASTDEKFLLIFQFRTQRRVISMPHNLLDARFTQLYSDHYIFQSFDSALSHYIMFSRLMHEALKYRREFITVFSFE